MYVKARGQKRVPSHLVKYSFSLQRAGVRKWSTVVCRPREVERLHGLWLDKTIAELEGERSSLFFESMINPYLDYCRSRHTAKWFAEESSYFLGRFREYFGEMEVRTIRRHDVESYLESQAALGIGPATRNKHLVALSGFFGWLIRREAYERVNPCFGLTVNAHDERTVRLTGDQVVEVVRASRVNPQLEMVVMLGLFCGLRRAEIMGLTWQSLDLDRRRLHLRAEETKSKRRRSVPLPSVLVEFLRDRAKPGGPVVESTVDRIRRAWGKVQKALPFEAGPGLGPLRLHDLRHLYAGGLRDAGVDLGDIAAFLGHSSVSVTESRYAQSGGYRGEEKVDRLAEVIPLDELRRRTG